MQAPPVADMVRRLHPLQAFLDLGARRFVAMHWGTFKLTDEPLDEPPRRLEIAWKERALAEERRSVLAIGETTHVGGRD